MEIRGFAARGRILQLLQADIKTRQYSSETCGKFPCMQPAEMGCLRIHGSSRNLLSGLPQTELDTHLALPSATCRPQSAAGRSNPDSMRPSILINPHRLGTDPDYHFRQPAD